MKEILILILALLFLVLWIAANIWFECWMWKQWNDDEEGRSL